MLKFEKEIRRQKVKNEDSGPVLRETKRDRNVVLREIPVRAGIQSVSFVLGLSADCANRNCHKKKYVSTFLFISFSLLSFFFFSPLSFFCSLLSLLSFCVYVPFIRRVRETARSY